MSVGWERKKEIVEFCIDRRQIIDKEALEALENEEHWKDLILQISTPIISAEKIKEKLVRHESKLGSVMQEVVVKKTSFRARAKDSSPDFHLMREHEAEQQSTSAGKVKDFLSYFRDKYGFLSSLIMQRQGFNPKPLDKLKTMQKYSEVDVIGMVVEKWVSKNGNITIELDSPEGKCIAIVSKENTQLTREAEKILVDDVIGVKGKKYSEEMVIVNTILWPDMMQKQPKVAERDLSIAVISDTHVGSRLFMEKEFTKFLSWLNGNTQSENDAERAGKIKYIVIAGDNVDGVGIYPDQYEELAIKDIYKQYERYAELISEIPEYIEAFICPGQHDAVRRADPQPAIPKEYVKDLAGLENIHFVGSPSWVEIEGLKCMIYHGGSFHDMYSSTKHLSVTEPEKAMIEMLKRRDLSTGFGLNQPYVPEKRDYMVIREEPDIYFGGDMHHKGYAQYRGCLVVNAGCWQERTGFQVKEGHVPTPGIAIDINLKTRKITENDFNTREGN